MVHITAQELRDAEEAAVQDLLDEEQAQRPDILGMAEDAEEFPDLDEDVEDDFDEDYDWMEDDDAWEDEELNGLDGVPRSRRAL